MRPEGSEITAVRRYVSNGTELALFGSVANLLVVDDDRSVAETLVMFLEFQGHAVWYASSGQAGIVAIGHMYPDAVFLDVDMPKMDGPEMSYRLIVEDAGKELIPIILVSGVHNIAEIAARVGTPYFVRKPYTLDTIERLTTLALNEKRPPRPDAKLGRR